MPTPEPMWKRIVWGLIGVGVLIGVLLLLRSDGISRAEVTEWQEIIVIGAVAAFGVVYLINLRRR